MEETSGPPCAARRVHWRRQVVAFAAVGAERANKPLTDNC
jgi:hypothetical protein